MVLVFQKNVKMLEIGIRRGVIILIGDIKSDHRHRQVAPMNPASLISYFMS